MRYFATMEVISLMYKEYLQINKEKTNNPKESWANDINSSQ